MDGDAGEAAVVDVEGVEHLVTHSTAETPRVADAETSASAANDDATVDKGIPSLAVEAAPVLVVDSWESTSPGPELQSTTTGEGLWMLSTDVLARRLAAQLMMNEEDTKELDEAVKLEDVKRILVGALSRQTTRAPEACIDPVWKSVTKQLTGAAADDSGSVCWTKFGGVESYAPTQIPAWHHILGSGLTSFLGLGAHSSSVVGGSSNASTRWMNGYSAAMIAGFLSLVHYGLTDESPYTTLLGSFGANAVLMFAAPAAPFCKHKEKCAVIISPVHPLS